MKYEIYIKKKDDKSKNKQNAQIAHFYFKRNRIVLAIDT
jgi:hypothetical protein